VLAVKCAAAARKTEYFSVATVCHA